MPGPRPDYTKAIPFAATTKAVVAVTNPKLCIYLIARKETGESVAAEFAECADHIFPRSFYKDRPDLFEKVKKGLLRRGFDKQFIANLQINSPGNCCMVSDKANMEKSKEEQILLEKGTDRQVIAWASAYFLLVFNKNGSRKQVNPELEKEYMRQAKIVMKAKAKQKKEKEPEKYKELAFKTWKARQIAKGREGFK